MRSVSTLSGRNGAPCGSSKTFHSASSPIGFRHSRQPRVGGGYAWLQAGRPILAWDLSLCRASVDSGSASPPQGLTTDPSDSGLKPESRGLGRMAYLVAACDLEGALACAQRMHSQLHGKATATQTNISGNAESPAASRASKQLYRKLYNQHSAFLSICCSAGRLDLALAYMKLLPAVPRAWSMLLRATLHAGKHGLAGPYANMRQVVDARLAAGLPADGYTATSLVTAAKLEGNLEAAMEAFEGGWSAGVCNSHLAAATLEAIAELGTREEALTLVERLQTAGVEMDEATYVSLFKALELCGDPSLVKHFLGTMRQEGIQTTSWTASAAISAAFSSGERDPQWFLDCYAWCRAAQLDKAPSDHAVCALCTALGGCELSHSEVETAFDIFSSLHNTNAKKAPSAQVYTSLLALCSKAGDPFRVLDVWEDIRQDGLAKEPSVLCAVLSCCASAARTKVQRAAPASQVYAVQELVWELYDSVLAAPTWPTSASLLAFPDELQAEPEEDSGVATGRGGGSDGPSRGYQAGAEPQPPKELISPDRRPLLPAFNSLLHYCARSGAVEQSISILGLMRGGTARQLGADGSASDKTTSPSQLLFHSPWAGQMDQAGPAPDLTSFNTVISGLASLGRHARAAFLLSEMEADGLSPDGVTFASLIHACATSGNLQAAKDIMASQRSNGVEPTLRAYTALMQACVQDGSQEALAQVADLLDEMAAEGLKPTAVTYAVVLQACLLRRDANAAFAIYSRAAEEQVLLSDACHNTLIKVCVATGRVDDGVEVVKEVARLHGEIQGHTLNALIRAVSNVSVDRALRLLSLMRTRNLKPSLATLIDLVDACARDGNARAAFSMYRGISNTKHDFPRSTGSKLLMALCRAGDKENALQVYNDMLSNAHGVNELKAPPYNHQGGQKRRRRRRLKYHCLPTPPARASLAFMLAQIGQTEEALAVVKLLAAEEGAEGMSRAARSNKEMFQELIMQFCRQDRIANALYVFDEWKAAFAMLPEEAGVESTLNMAVLAFLEASCRRHEDYSWRTYDVLAVMRQQREIGTQATLERPQKQSHHFTERVTRSN